MSVIGINEIHKRIKEQKLLENLGQRELDNPEGVGVDLRLGEIHKITEGGAFIEVDGAGGLGKRKGVKTELIAKFDPDSKAQEEVTIEPGEYYLVATFEKVNTPQDLMPMIYPRSSLFRAGLLLLNSKTDPGYSGTLTMGLINLSKFPTKLQMGARICNMVFYTIDGDAKAYRGQHQGGRISFEEEQQV
jgi:deoxycytidine triphosphate deaminase